MLCILMLISITLVVAASYRIYNKLSRRQNQCYACLIGKTVIITGANSGIGYITALDFASRGARIILGCRDEDKAKRTREKIISTTGNLNVVLKLIDMHSLESIRNFARDINKTEQRIDILVNNAGAMMLGKHKTMDGLDITMQTNHFGGFLLTHLLLDKLKSSAPSRIVNLTSCAANYYVNLDPNDLNKYPEGFGHAFVNTLYANSKLCTALFTIELAKKLKGTNVTVNCLHPGLIVSNMVRNFAFYHRIILHLFRFIAITPEEGAQTTIYVALSKELEGVSGRLFVNCRETKMYENAKDASLAEKVWTESEKLVKLRDEEKVNRI